MRDSELQIDRSCHVLYSKPCKKEILAKITLHYPEVEREAVWEQVQLRYAELLSKWRTDLGGKKNFHNGVGGTYDCIAIMSYYVVCKAITSFREIEEMEENLILPTFRKLKFVDCNKPFWRKLMYRAFVRAKSGCDKWHDYEMSVAPYENGKPIYYEFTSCPAAEFAIRHGLADIMPALCNVDYASMELQSKVILCTTAVLLIAPAMYFYFFEFDDLTRKERLLSSLFQAVTPRTAGFNTVELTDLSEAGQFITIALMLIGGSPGSTAGGLKTTTIAVLLTTAISTFRRRENANLFGRRIDDDVVKNAATISLMYITLCCTGGLIISVSEGLPMLTCLFETASAVGTVGLSLGITPELNLLSRSVLILLMFFGRVGGLTLIFAALSSAQKKVSKLPKEKITVG